MALCVTARDPVTVEFADEPNPATPNDPPTVAPCVTTSDPVTVEFADEPNPATPNEPAIV